MASNGSLSLLAGGDIGPTVQPVTRHAELIAPILERADFRFGQCERTYSTRGFYPRWTTVPGGEHSRVPPEYAEIFRAANINVVSLASNHTLDWMYDPLFDSIDLLQSWGIQVVGAGRDGSEAHRPAIIEHDGVRVAVLAYTSVLRDGHSASEGVPGLAAIRVRTWYEPREFQPGSPLWVRSQALPEDVAEAVADVKAAREIADAVVVSIHWGIRHVPKVLAEYQEPVAHALIDAGASVIVGHHPHTPKAVEQYGDGIIFYSVGNFMTSRRCSTKKEKSGSARWGVWWFERDFDWPKRDLEYDNAEALYCYPRHCRPAMLPMLRFSKDGLASASIIPMYMNKLAQPEPLRRSDPRYGEVLEYFEWVSSEFPHRFEPGDDEIVIGR